ncbi:hypothetical protein [Rhizobium sp. NXC24]|uniref:hypothetical protein n=1 Tax=Rhizobium sp. NXC24 TaxID=2048897 RepID=UPI000CDF432A|nr:hypothetical protein [Rhizobium sp. NXC24]AVA25827.1 hypothetical protein NXC24_PC01394 [Rhizobium sp. NXC24]
MSGRFVKFAEVLGISAGLSVTFSDPASAGCWSALKSPEWQQVSSIIASAKLCEQMPSGPNRTRRLEVTAVDFCTAPSGVSVTANVSLTCGSSSDSFLQLSPLDGKVVATVTLDIGACKVTDSDINISGQAGEILSKLPQTQEFLRTWAQIRLSNLCGMQ